MNFNHNKLAEALKTLPEIAFAYLFGSAQNGTITEGSDTLTLLFIWLTTGKITMKKQLEYRRHEVQWDN